MPDHSQDQPPEPAGESIALTGEKALPDPPPRRGKNPPYPVLWATVLMFGMVAFAAADNFTGVFLFAVCVPAILLGQWIIRWLLNRSGTPVALRRTVMLVPAIAIAWSVYASTNRFGGRQTTLVTQALAGHTPSGLQNLYVEVDNWTDLVVLAYFRCDPLSLRGILERPPFEREENGPDSFSFASSGLREIQHLPTPEKIVAFTRTDLDPMKGHCRVYTDAAFSFAYVEFGLD